MFWKSGYVTPSQLSSTSELGAGSSLRPDMKGRQLNCACLARFLISLSRLSTSNYEQCRDKAHQ